MKISKEKIQLIKTMRAEGKSVKYIRENLKVGVDTIIKYAGRTNKFSKRKMQSGSDLLLSIPNMGMSSKGIALNLGKEFNARNEIVKLVPTASADTVGKIYTLLQEDKMQQELNKLHVEYMDKEEAIRSKYNVG